MRHKKLAITASIILLLSFFLEGISDPNVFVFANWRQNNIVNILFLWFVFLTTYYLFSFTVTLGLQKLRITTSKKLIGLLLITAAITFLWVFSADLLFYLIYYEIESLSETTFYEFDLPLTIVFLTIGCVYFYQKNYLKPIAGKPLGKLGEPSESEKRIKAFQGAKDLYVNQDEIGMVYVSDKLTWIKTRNGQLLRTNDSLLNLTDELSPELFFRLNRQVIISKMVVKGYKRLDYQKLEVITKERFTSDLNLVVSKYNAPGFKKWLTNST